MPLRWTGTGACPYDYTMIRRFSLTLILLALAAFPAVARAHAGLLSADPAPGSTVPASPTEIRLTFNDRLAPGSTFTVSTGFFQTVPGINPVVEDDALRATLTAPLVEGTYTVQWKALTEDGGVTEGSYQFRVGQSNTLPLWAWGVAVLGAAIVGVVFWIRGYRAKSSQN